MCPDEQSALEIIERRFSAYFVSREGWDDARALSQATGPGC